MRGILFGILGLLIGGMAIVVCLLNLFTGPAKGQKPDSLLYTLGAGGIGVVMVAGAGFSIFVGINEIRDSMPAAPRRRKRRRPPTPPPRSRRRRDEEDDYDDEDDRPRRRRRRRDDDDED